MAESLKNREHQESQEHSEVSPERYDQMLQYADEQLDKAVKSGVLRREDRMKVYAQIDKLTPSQVANAEKILDDYIGKKKEKREDYIKQLDEAVANGLISVEEHQDYLQKYDKMPGKDRQKEQEEKWPKRIEVKKMEKKAFGELLQESPHYFHEGKLTPEAEALLEAYNDKLNGEREQLVLKRRLIKDIKKLDAFADMCKERYQIANEHYNRGDYESSAKLMKKNIRTCERYPQSARLKEFQTFAKGDFNNAVYEQLKNEQMQNKREEVQECFQGEDHEAALVCAGEAVKMMEGIISTTYDGKQGVYQEGSSSEKPRSEKWVTPHMRQMLAKLKAEEAQAKNIYETFRKQEVAEEQAILSGEMDLLDEEQAADKRDQALIKAAIDSFENLSKEDEQPKEMQESQQVSQEQEQVLSQTAQDTEFNIRDQEEDHELQDSFVDTKKAFVDEESHSPSDSEETDQHLSQEQAKTLSQEELKDQQVTINEEKGGRLNDQKANQLLQSEAELKLTKEGRELQTKQQIEAELSRKLSESRLENIDELRKTGKISAETAALHIHQAEEMNKRDIGSQILRAQGQQGNLVQGQNQQHTTSKLKTFFSGKTDREDLQQRMKENADKKREQLRKAA